MKGSVQKMGGVFLVALVIGFTALAISGWEWPLTGQIFENKRIVYPLYSSVCCEAKNFGDWDSASYTNIASYMQSYVCPDSTTQCRVRTPQIQCPGMGWTYPLGTTPVWYLEVTNPGDINPTSYCNQFFCNQIPNNGREFSPSGSVRYRGACIDNVFFINPTNIISIINLLNGRVVTPTYGHLDIEFVHTELWRYPAMEGQYSIPNTVLCTRNSEVDALIKKNPVEKDLAQAAKSIVEQEEGIDLDPSQIYQGELSTSIFPMKPGQCYLTVDKWIDLPFWGNVNPLGQYLSQDVICSPSKGLIKIEEVGTLDGTGYFVPTQRLQQPNFFCCSHGDCLAYGIDYNCVDYSCQKIQGYCNSDLQCQPQGGEMQDANCYKDRTTGKFYEWYGGCDLTTNTCKTPTTTEVACCPSYCSQWGQWCDKKNGCKDAIIPKPDCPSGFCCDGVTHQKQGCASGLQCCTTADPHVGVCQESCGNLCLEKGQPCDLSPGECCPGLECSGGFLGLIGKICQEPIVNWNWVWIIILALIGSGIGYVVGKWKGAILLGILGGVIGFLYYWFTTLAWWQQWLLGIGGVVGGGLMVYLFGGAILAFVVMLIVALKK